MSVKYTELSLSAFLSVVAIRYRVSINKELRERYGWEISKLCNLLQFEMIEMQHGVIHYDTANRVLCFAEGYYYRVFKDFVDNNYLRHKVGRLYNLTDKAHELIRDMKRVYMKKVNSKTGKLALASPAPRAHSG